MYELIDGPTPERCRELLADDLRFSIVFSNGPGAAEDFAGGRAAFDGYLAQRAAPTWTHHVLAESAHGAVELVLGETRQDGAPLATFVAAGAHRRGRPDRPLRRRSLDRRALRPE